MAHIIIGKEKRQTAKTHAKEIKDQKELQTINRVVHIINQKGWDNIKSPL